MFVTRGAHVRSKVSSNLGVALTLQCFLALSCGWGCAGACTSGLISLLDWTAVRVCCKGNGAFVNTSYRATLMVVSHQSHMAGPYSNLPHKFLYCDVYVSRSATGTCLKDSAWTTGSSPPTYQTVCSTPHSLSPPSW